MITVPLDKQKHKRNQFDCGVDVLNNYLRMMADQQSKKDNSRTFVLIDENHTGRIIAYYTLTMIPFNLSALPEKLEKKHKNAQTGGLIARLAVDKGYARQGYGEWVLIDALKKLCTASKTVAFPLVIVDAKEGVIEFYEKFGFTPFLDTPNKLFISMLDVRASLKL